MATLLSIVQDACYIVGMPAPTAVVSSNNETPKRMLRLINEEGRSLAREHDWSKLKQVESFATDTVNREQTAQPPSDFDRFSPTTALWDVANRKPLVGVVSTNAWLRLLVDDVSSVERYWIMLNGKINITPVTGTADTIYYAYQSKNWVAPASGSNKAEFTLDTDTSLLPDELLKLGLIWRWQNAIGVDYSESLATYGRQKEMSIAADRGNTEISMTTDFHGDLPDSYWAGRVTTI